MSKSKKELESATLKLREMELLKELAAKDRAFAQLEAEFLTFKRKNVAVQEEEAFEKQKVAEEYEWNVIEAWAIAKTELATAREAATKAAVEGKPLTLHAPLLHMSKAEIIRQGIKLGVDFSITVSCYQADDQGRACGVCDSCRLRRAGFELAGVPDLTRYRKS